MEYWVKLNFKTYEEMEDFAKLLKTSGVKFMKSYRFKGEEIKYSLTLVDGYELEKPYRA